MLHNSFFYFIDFLPLHLIKSFQIKKWRITMIKFDHFSFGFPQKDLYEDINLEISTGDHLALIGSNGSGKSTLINLILHEEKYTYEGLIRKDDNIRIGYISQFVEHATMDGNVSDFLAAPFKEILLKNDDLCLRMGQEDDLDLLYEEYQKVLDEIESIDAYNYESNISKALASANLSHLSERNIDQLSGGEYKLLFILRNMLLSPQLLIMDEPDVFLDFENLIALIKMINEYKGTLLVITHNRLLLTQCFNKIWNIEDKSIGEFIGSFPQYVRFMLETKIEVCEHVRDFDEFIKKQEETANKIRHMAEMTMESNYGRNLKARASYIERLRKMRGDDPYLEDHDHNFKFLFEDISAENDTDKVSESNVEDKLGALEIKVENYTLQYDGDEALLKNVNLTIAPGEKVSIVGSNGTGKSSLLRDIYALLEKEYPDETGYFKQIIESDDVLKLSGGERNLAQIEQLCNKSYKALILDEPTSHLDIYAQIELEKAIREYPGTVVMVSHDLFAVTSCSDRVLVIEDGTIREMTGRAYRKSIYKNYFASDIFEAEKERIDTEIKVTNLLKAGKYDDARKVLGFPKEEK